ncbi:galactosamine-6-phosphate isomerase [Lelliottia amnigena]|uniref:galactosamine-6-phosphate isomerase n=1 Tax=Lelliottia amnigena TaxID=61646 RepID=UPI001F2EBB8A|nr:galactosamine-6-phosphate isomerase [Lelliottia amnigena]UJD96185.1 galactosamine-6-phosphate isomerase [Lelliottia amnigena]
MNGITFQVQSDDSSLSEAASEKLLALIHRKPDAVICLATGATPVMTYQLLVEKIIAQQVDISRITFVKLDEWVGLAPDNPATCEVFLQHHILQPLGIAPENYISFRSDNADEQECARIVEQIAQRGGLDLCVLGIGKNGHLGLNEPDEKLEPACHITHLDERTRLHEMLKQANVPVEKGITLGLRDILAAREVLLLVSGEGKQRAFAAFKEGKVTTQIPASFLWLHPKTTCLYCDM